MTVDMFISTKPFTVDLGSHTIQSVKELTMTSHERPSFDGNTV